MRDLNLNWTSNRIHSLRLRLGWSCNDLARRLECSSNDILQWEQNNFFLDDKYFSKLELIEKQAEEICHEMQVCPLAESKLESSDKEQILLDEFL